MSELEWLDAVRADLDEATPGPWRWRNTEEPLLVGARSRIVMAFSRMGMQRAQPEFRDADGLLTKAGKANLNSYPDAHLIASAPERLDRMERALRAALELAESWRYKGEFGWDDGSHAYGPGPEGEALDWASAEVVSKIQEALG